MHARQLFNVLKEVFAFRSAAIVHNHDGCDFGLTNASKYDVQQRLRRLIGRNYIYMFIR